MSASKSKAIIFLFSTFEIPFYQNRIFCEFSVLMWFPVFCPFCHVLMIFACKVIDDCKRKLINRSGNWQCRKHLGKDLEVKGIHWYLKNTFKMFTNRNFNRHTIFFKISIAFNSFFEYFLHFFFNRNEIHFSIFYLQIL